MDDRRLFDRAQEVFLDVCDLPDSDRAAALDARCGDDAALRREVEALLRADRAGSEGRAGPQRGQGADLLAQHVDPEPADDAPLPERVGAYRVVRQIGRGGMGVVYEAEQDSPRRRVALKVIRPGFARGNLVRRFAYEAQVLGALQHPGIAHVYEAGTADIGTRQPFFAMELVDGQPLDAHADAVGLTIDERLELIARVCDGMQHAHQKGVIHRDVKPANILVVEQSGTRRGDGSAVVDRIGQPKILDFGVARATDADLEATTMQTEAGQIIGTLAYMAPEQIEGRSQMLDTRCDVYALGSVMYTLLAGRPPHDLAGASIAEAARLIREVDPPRVGTVNPALRGDIETIVGKAMEKDRERRYDSAAALADDIHRYLRREPVLAHPPSATYQIRKFASRNKGLVAGLLAAVAALVLGLVGMGVLLAESSRQRARAETEAERSGRVAELMTAMVSGVDPSVALGRDTTVLRGILDRAAASLDGDLDEAPEVEATMRQTIGDTLRAIAAYDEAGIHLERAMELRRELGDPLAIARCGVSLAHLRAARGDHAGAERLYQEHGEALASIIGPDEVETLLVAGERAGALSDLSRYAEASELFDEIVETLERVAPGSEELADMLGDYAVSLHEEGNLDAAEERYRASMASYEASLDPDHPSISVARTGLGMLLYERGSFEQAKRVLTQAVESSERVLGTDHPSTLGAMNNLTMVMWYLGDREEVIAMTRELYERRKRALGPEHPEVASAMSNLAFVTLNSGHPEKAEVLYRELLDLRIRIWGEKHEDVAHTIGEIAWVLMRSDRVDEAIPMYERALELRLELQGETDWNVSYMRTWLGECHRLQARYDVAEPILRRAVAGYEDILGDDHFRTAAARTRLGECLLDMDRPDEAMGLLRAAHQTFLDQRGPEDVSTKKLVTLMARAEAAMADGASGL